MTAGSPTHASDSKTAAKCARPGNQADIPQHKNGLHVIEHFRNVQELRQSRELEKTPVKYLCKEAEPKACSGQWEWLSTVVTEDVGGRVSNDLVLWPSASLVLYPC